MESAAPLIGFTYSYGTVPEALLPPPDGHAAGRGAEVCLGDAWVQGARGTVKVLVAWLLGEFPELERAEPEPQPIRDEERAFMRFCVREAIRQWFDEQKT